MANLVTLSCPSCGGKLKGTSYANRFICENCGSEFLFEQTGNNISLTPVLEKLSDIQSGIDKIAEGIKWETCEITFSHQRPKHFYDDLLPPFLVGLLGLDIFEKPFYEYPVRYYATAIGPRGHYAIAENDDLNALIQILYQNGWQSTGENAKGNHTFRRAVKQP